MKIVLFDTFNKRKISSHRTVKNAVIAQRRFAAAVRRANGANSYLPTEIQGCDYNELIQTEQDLFYR